MPTNQGKNNREKTDAAQDKHSLRGDVPGRFEQSHQHQEVKSRPWSLIEFLQHQSWQCPECHQTWVIFDTSSKQFLHICKRCGYCYNADREHPQSTAA
jgi:rubredoxin